MVTAETRAVPLGHECAEDDPQSVTEDRVGDGGNSRGYPSPRFWDVHHKIFQGKPVLGRRGRRPPVVFART